MNIKFKRLFEIEIFCNIINVFTFTSDQFNVSCLFKLISFFKIKKTFITKTNVNLFNGIFASKVTCLVALECLY